MRCFGIRREASFALGLAVALGMSSGGRAVADGYHLHPTLPKEMPAYDFNTGGEYFAPPVPYGHYAKDKHAAAAKALGHVAGPIHGLKGKLAGLHGLGAGHGHGHGDGMGHGHGGGLGHGHGGLGGGCGLGCKDGGMVVGSGLSGLAGHGHGHGLGGGHGHGAATYAPVVAGHPKNFGPYHPAGVVATSQSAPSAQAVVMPAGHGACGPNGCGQGGCGLKGHLAGLGAKLKCKLCGGGGCGGCGGAGFGDPCGSCGGGGCGSCGGCGLLSKLKQCLHCGGAGCKSCLAGLGGLKGKLHGLLGGIAGPKYDYFVGAGGPVPLTPGYVPYIVTTRSPRDFFAFPPMTPDGF